MENVLYIGRDKDGDTFGYTEKPSYDEEMEMWYDQSTNKVAVIPDSWFPDIKPGECKKFVMVE